jgi:oligoribonuclease NrnB/cAMP/cGMP phosphodiesterase (DHH superfamily)
MILVTHVDLDGAGCAIVGKIFFPILQYIIMIMIQ